MSDPFVSNLTDFLQSQELGYKIWGRSMGIRETSDENERNTKGEMIFLVR